MTLSKLNIFKRKLFWKILGVFWLTSFLTIIANITITRQIVNVEQRYQQVQSLLQDIAQEAVVIYENAGAARVQQWYQSLYAQHRMRAILFDPQDRPVGEPVTRKHRKDNAYRKEHDRNKQLHRIGAALLPPPWRQTLPSLTTQTVLTKSGEKYVLRVLPSPFVHNTMASFHDYKLYRFLVSLLIISLGSFWLSRSVARPVKYLTEASKHMAEGDLSVRVSNVIGRRSDELGELSTAFDHMAKQTEAQIANQKQLLRDISHEIRTPLTRQQIAIELARQGAGNTALLEKIEQQNHQLNELIDGLLTFSRLSDGSQKTHLEAIDISPLIENVCEAAELEADKKHIKIERMLCHPSGIQGNWVLTSRAVDNILGNALKHSPEHSTITISTKIEHHNLLVQIEDQGPGIDEQSLPHIFEPFYRADESRHKSTGGYGLGLAIVNQIMKQHHGQVELNNSIPNGLSVCLYFPLPNSDNKTE